jgi:hypothetical protein
MPAPFVDAVLPIFISHGKIRTIQLEYTDAKDGPVQQVGNNCETTSKGEITKRTIFMQKGMKADLTPYLHCEKFMGMLLEGCMEENRVLLSLLLTEP